MGGIEYVRNYLCSCTLVIAIFSALLIEGANNAYLSSLFACVFLALVALGLAFYPLKAWDKIDLSLKWTLGILVVCVSYIVSSLVANPWMSAHPIWKDVPIADGIGTVSYYRTIEGLAAFLGPVGAFFAGRMFAEKRIGRDIIFNGLVWGSIPYSLYALSLYGAEGGRLDVNFTSANTAATSFYLFLFLSLTKINIGISKRAGKNFRLPTGARMVLDTPLSLVACILAFVCILLTASRTGIVLSCCGFIAISLSNFFFTSKGKTGSFLGKTLITITFVAVLFAALGSEYAFRRFDDNFAQHAHTREVMVEAHWNVFLERPIFGHGMNTFHDLNQMAASPENWASIVGVGSAHNVFVNALEEVGIVGVTLGALLVCSFLIGVLRHLKNYRTGSSDVHWAFAACIGGSVCLLHGVVDFGLQVPAISFLLMCVIGAASGRTFREKSR